MVKSSYFWSSLLLAGLVVLVDAWTKQTALQVLLPSGQSYPVLYVGEAGWRWTFAWNTGVSFSLFNDAGAVGRWGLSLVAILAILLFTWWLRQEKTALGQTGLALVIGGAAGNLIDRVIHGAVVDFIHVHYGTWHFPIFNLADSAITVGVVLLICSSLVHDTSTKNKGT